MLNKALTILTVAIMALASTACEQDLNLNIGNEGEGEVEIDVDSEDKLPGEGEGEGEGEVEQPPPPPPPPPQLAESTKAQLVWKRYRALEQDLVRGLGLTSAEVCNELDRFNCIDIVHLSALGGNEPFEKSQFEPTRAPTATSSIATDRVVLSACVKRVERDRAGTPLVFTGLDLNASSVSEGDADVVTTELFRRLLARDPTTDELEAARALTTTEAGASIPAADFAALSCYAVGTHVEFLFF